METREFVRATEPHRESLGAALFPVLGPNFVRYDKGVVYVTADFADTTNQAVQTVVTAAPQASLLLDAKAYCDRLTLIERAISLTMLDLVNVERARHSAAAVTRQQFVTAVKAKVDELGA